LSWHRKALIQVNFLTDAPGAKAIFAAPNEMPMMAAFGGI
jgi:hypothetical protein